MSKILELDHIYKNYLDGKQKKDVLKDVSFNVSQGEFSAIMGPSGAGKSTLLTIIGALLHPSHGSVIFDGKDITQLSKKEQTELRLKKMGFIFQYSELIPYLKVSEQLSFIQKMAHNNSSDPNLILKQLGLEHELSSYPYELSGGQKQRVAIARALINQPELILADEPTASLDSKRGREVVQIIQNIAHQENRGAVMVTHDERILDLVDTIWQIEDGHLKKIN